MQKSQQELIEIADKMLADLENDYLQTQQFNQVECPEEEPSHQDYHILGGDEQPDQMSDEDEDENEQEQAKEGQILPQSTQVKEEVKEEAKQETKHINESLEQSKANQEIGELVEVFPTEEWKAPEKQININSEKIKQLTLSMNLPVPEWMKNDEMLKNRIIELFGKKTVK